MNSNNTNNLEIVAFDPKGKKTDGRKRKSEQISAKGSWTEKRLVAVLVTYREYRPLGVAYGEVTKQWNAMTDAVNEFDPEVAPLRKNAVKEKLEDLMRQYKPTFSEQQVDKASGSNKHTPTMEREARSTYEKVS